MSRIFSNSLFFLLISGLIYSAVARPQTDPQQPQYNEWKAAWGNLKDAFKNVGSWFVRHYRNVQSWFANSREELEKKVQDMVNFLGQVRENMNALVVGAGDNLKAALQNVNNYYTDVTQFQQRVRAEAAVNFQALQQEWQMKVQNMYNSGLGKIVDAAEASKMDIRQQDPQPGPAQNGTGGSTG